jgi:hypothetical protein
MPRWHTAHEADGRLPSIALPLGLEFGRQRNVKLLGQVRVRIRYLLPDEGPQLDLHSGAPPHKKL